MWTIQYRIGTLSGALELGEAAAVARHVHHLKRQGAEDIRITGAGWPGSESADGAPASSGR